MNPRRSRLVTVTPCSFDAASRSSDSSGAADGVDLPFKREGVVYWMNRDARFQDNHALLYAQEMALKQRVPLFVVVCLNNEIYFTRRQASFLFKGSVIIVNRLYMFSLAGSGAHECRKPREKGRGS